MTFDSIKNFFVVLLALCCAISGVGGAINLILNWKKGSKTTKHEITLQNHERRIKKLEDDSEGQESFTKVLCNSVLALVSHEINGNSHDKLEKAQEELQEFLINK